MHAVEDWIGFYQPYRLDLATRARHWAQLSIFRVYSIDSKNYTAARSNGINTLLKFSELWTKPSKAIASRASQINFHKSRYRRTFASLRRITSWIKSRKNTFCYDSIFCWFSLKLTENISLIQYGWRWGKRNPVYKVVKGTLKSGLGMCTLWLNHIMLYSARPSVLPDRWFQYRFGSHIPPILN